MQARRGFHVLLLARLEARKKERKEERSKEITKEGNTARKGTTDGECQSHSA
jgi:hypothetical protein